MEQMKLGEIYDIGHEIREKIIRYSNGEEEIIAFANKINDGKTKEEIVEHLQYLIDKYHVSIDISVLRNRFLMEDFYDTIRVFAVGMLCN